MPKYTNDIVAGYTLYFTSKCIVEAMHVHASDKALKEESSAKLFVYDNGDSKSQMFPWHKKRAIEFLISIALKNRIKQL